MEGRLLLKDCSVFRSDGRVRSGVAVLIEAERIVAVEENDALAVRPGDWEVSCRGRLVSPGLIDCHSHMVTGQLAPTSGERLLRSMTSRFEEATALGRLLTPLEAQTLAASAIAEGLRNGTTLRFEHLHAPSDVASALEGVARVAEALGSRMVLSHATTSTDGSSGEAAVEANAAWAKDRREHPLVRGALGFWGSFCCDDSLLRLAGRLREELSLGVHFHFAEGEEDLTQTYTRHGKRIVARFESFGLLGAGCVGAYARALDRNEAQALQRTRTLVAASPALGQLLESGVGGLESTLSQQNLVGLGTCGPGTLFQEVDAALRAVLAIARTGRLLDPDGAVAQLLVGGPSELCTMVFGQPCGTVEPGALGDLVVWDLVPGAAETHLDAANLMLRLSAAKASWTIVGGRVVVREGQLLGHDAIELSREASKALAAVWKRSGLGAPPPIGP